MNWLISRLTEPTSYAGLGLFVHAVNSIFAPSGLHVDPVTLTEAAGGLLSFILPEASPLLNTVSQVVQSAVNAAATATSTANAAAGTARAALDVAHANTAMVNTGKNS